VHGCWPRTGQRPDGAGNPPEQRAQQRHAGHADGFAVQDGLGTQHVGESETLELS